MPARTHASPTVASASTKARRCVTPEAELSASSHVPRVRRSLGWKSVLAREVLDRAEAKVVGGGREEKRWEE